MPLAENDKRVMPGTEPNAEGGSREFSQIAKGGKRALGRDVNFQGTERKKGGENLRNIIPDDEGPKWFYGLGAFTKIKSGLTGPVTGSM